MVDEQGYRPNIGIIIANHQWQLLLAKRYDEDAWQFPQGGIKSNETVEQALFRELYEEVGLTQNQVRIIAKTPKWLRYRLPEQYIRRYKKPLCIGQKQVWYLLELIDPTTRIVLDNHLEIEFDDWKWVEYWQPIEEVIYFKREIYEDTLKAFAPILFNNNHCVPTHYKRPLKCQAICL